MSAGRSDLIKENLSVNWTINGIFKTRADPSTFYAHRQIDFPRESSVIFVTHLDGKGSLGEGTKGLALFTPRSPLPHSASFVSWL